MKAIIVAMQKELELMLQLTDGATTRSINGYEFIVGFMGEQRVVIMQCGIGKVNAALGAQTLIENFNPSLIINSGVAGGTGQGAGILDVVVADRIGYHDVWCGPGTQWGEAAGCPAFFTPPVDAHALAKQIGAKVGLIASGDIFVSRPEDVERILALYPDAIAVDMESGAIAQVCYRKGVPMICLRVVSDTPGAADNISQYLNFWTDAPQHTFRAIQAALKVMPS